MNLFRYLNLTFIRVIKLFSSFIWNFTKRRYFDEWHSFCFDVTSLAVIQNFIKCQKTQNESSSPGQVIVHDGSLANSLHFIASLPSTNTKVLNQQTRQYCRILICNRSTKKLQNATPRGIKIPLKLPLSIFPSPLPTSLNRRGKNKRQTAWRQKDLIETAKGERIKKKKIVVALPS